MNIVRLSSWIVVGALTALALPGVASAQGMIKSENVECIAPANAGGGWDFTCRQVGKTLYDIKLVGNPVRVTNMAGGGGGVAFANVVNKRNNDNDLIIAASSATATRLAQGAYPGNTMGQVRWVGTVGADYGVIAVGKNSKISSLTELMAKIKADPSSVSVAGGSSVGGWDHLKVLIAAKASGIDDVRTVKYVAFEGGGEAVTSLIGGHVQAFSGDISEVTGFVDSGDLRILAVLSPERLPGKFDQFPTAKEQGIDAVGANWRGFYAPGGMSDDVYNSWTDAVSKVYASAEWKKIMTANGLMPLDLQGDKFTAFVADHIEKTKTLSKEIGLLK